jgi:lysophospholipase L1-like esterase
VPSAAPTASVEIAHAAPNPASSAATATAPKGPVEEKFSSGVAIDQSGVGGPAPGPELPKGSTVLHIGDSFAGALGIELNKVLDKAGVKSLLRFETSTYIPTWAHDKKLPEYLAQYKPDLVLVSLGANELQNPEPEKRIPLIRRIVDKISSGNRSCAWVAPVLWDGANPRLLEVIRANVAPCVYLDSNAFITHKPRARDRIHPSMDARPDWAGVIARWLAYHRKPTAQNTWALDSGNKAP